MTLYKGGPVYYYQETLLKIQLFSFFGSIIFSLRYTVPISGL